MTGKTSFTMPPSRPEVAALLADEVLSGRVRPGEKLPSERELSERFGVSRPVVREALRGLAERKLVEVHPGRGAYVRAARATDAAAGMDAAMRRHQATPRHLAEARTMLEATSAALAAERATREDLAAMAAALAGLAEATGLVDRARHDLAFHLAIARAAHNPVVETMFGAIAGLTLELLLRSLADPEVTRLGLGYHDAILAAIRERDAERARQTMVEHLAVASRTYGDDFDQTLDAVARRELERAVDTGTTLDELLATVPGGGADGRG